MVMLAFNLALINVVGPVPILWWLVGIKRLLSSRKHLYWKDRHLLPITMAYTRKPSLNPDLSIINPTTKHQLKATANAIKKIG